MSRRVVWCLALAACHVTSRSEITRPGHAERVRHPEAAVARPPTLVISDAGWLRFVEPLECPAEELVTDERALEVERQPNVATFVVGVIATAVGGILTVRGLNDGDGSANPFTFGGIGLLATGLPLAIGPWIGNTTELRALPGEATPTRRPVAAEPCGARPLAAKTALLMVRGIEVFGTVDGDGVFAISPFQLADAFEAATATSAWDIAARVATLAGPRSLDVVIDGRTFVAHASEFLAKADFDTRIEPMRLVPGLTPGTLRVSLTTTADGHAAARIVLAVKNDGPGPTWALRGHVIAPSTPALDGRVIYFGHVAKGATVTRELLVPMTPVAAGTLRNATVEVALELRDAHGTAPTTPVRFRGAVLVDAPR